MSGLSAQLRFTLLSTPDAMAKRAKLTAGMKPFEDVRAEEQNGTNVTSVKSALALQGLDCGPVRAPLAWPLTAAQPERLRRFMEQNDLIGKP